MGSIKQGNKSILFFRDYEKRATEDGSKLAYQVEHSLDYNVEIENIITKDGNIPTATDGENTISVTSYAYDEEDGGVALWKKLRDLFLAKKKVEIWEVDTESSTDDGEYQVRYFRGLFASVSEPKPAEGAIELSFEYTIEGQGVDGKETLSTAQLNAIQATLYEYETIKALGESEEGK